ncbi:MAG: anthranilate synthase component I, partial [Pseudomonadota bacterium]
MDFQPSFEGFEAPYKAGKPQVVWTDIVADIETTVSLMLKLGAADINTFILESVTGGEVRGRYTVIGLEPDLIWRARGDKAEINRRVAETPDVFDPESSDTLTSLRALI